MIDWIFNISENITSSRNSHQSDVDRSQIKTAVESTNVEDQQKNERSRYGSANVETNQKITSKRTSANHNIPETYESDPAYNKDDRSDEFSNAFKLEEEKDSDSKKFAEEKNDDKFDNEGICKDVTSRAYIDSS